VIPKILHRVVGALTTDETERFWAAASDLHPGWKHVTWRDPLDPADFPLTAAHWPECTSGAQFAGLIRLEVLYTHGGIYLDSDFEPYRSLDPLRGCDLFAGWQDRDIVPDAVLGAKAGHPAMRDCIDLACARLGEGAHRSGPDVTTEILPAHHALLLPPGSFYPYHYSERKRRGEDHRSANPWAYGAHHWAASWVTTVPRELR
jgi:mannosyltransferase OCH1-like enzyme